MRYLILFLLTCAVCVADLSVQNEYIPGKGAFVTVPDVGPGWLEVQRSTDLTNWTTFAIASMPAHLGFTNTYRFHDYLSTSNQFAFYRAMFIP